MKLNISRIGKQIIAIILGVSSLYGQGTFQNLSFENPVLPLIPDESFEVPITNAIPGWRGYIGINQVDKIVYNTVSLGAATISIQGPGSSRPILQGSYSLILQPQFGSGIPVPALAQTGLVPASAKSIGFYSGGAGISISFAGQDIPLSIIGSGPGYSIFGGDVSAFANVSGELRLQGGGTLDNIFFSDLPIPEPTSFALWGIGGLLLGWNWRRRIR